MKLTALTSTTVTSTVSGTAVSAVSERVSPFGSRANDSCTPSTTITPAQATCPASLVSGSIGHRSSTAPSRQMRPPATSTDRGSP